MRGKLYTKKDKGSSRKLVLQGKTYREIGELLGIPKSTLSTWYGKTVKKPESRTAMLSRLARIRKFALIALRNKRERNRMVEKCFNENIVKKDLANFPLDNLPVSKALLAMLYWAEGSKVETSSGLKFVNTDPDLMLFYITLLRKCYPIEESRLRVGLHVHYYHSIKKVKKFWEKLLSIPQTQFNKVYIKQRSVTKRYRKNFSGICFIYYGDSRMRRELLMFAKSLKQLFSEEKRRP